VARREAVAFSDFELKRIQKAVGAYVQRRRPAPHIRKELDISFRIGGQSVELFEIRPAWRRPGETIEHSIIKATYVKRSRTWKVYWKRADLKWHRYDPEPEANTIEAVLEIAERDEYGCFYG
jgi:hypothetical protein